MSKHDCFQRIDEKLAERNTKLAMGMDLYDDTRELILVCTEKKNSRVKGGPTKLFASHCPFCGIKLNEARKP